MGWAKYEEDNREAWTDRYVSGNYFWNPCKDYSACKMSNYSYSQQNKSATYRDELLLFAQRKTVA